MLWRLTQRLSRLSPERGLEFLMQITGRRYVGKPDGPRTTAKMVRFGREIMKRFTNRSLREEGEVYFSGWNWKNWGRIEIMAKKRHFCCNTIVLDRSEVLCCIVEVLRKSKECIKGKSSSLCILKLQYYFFANEIFFTSMSACNV